MAYFDLRRNYLHSTIKQKMPFCFVLSSLIRNFAGEMDENNNIQEQEVLLEQPQEQLQERPQEQERLVLRTEGLVKIAKAEPPRCCSSNEKSI